MHVALVKNSKDNIHDKDRGEDEERQRPEELLEDEAFSLHLAFYRRRQDLGRGLFDEIGHVAERRVRLGIEAESDAGKLVQVVDRLQAEPRG